jgi:hypothetical protein
MLNLLSDIKRKMWGHVTEEKLYNLEFSPNGARGSVVVKALCYKPDGRGFDSR